MTTFGRPGFCGPSVMVAAWAGAAVSRIDAIETTRRIDSQYHVRKADDERQNDRSITVMVDLIDLAAQAAMTFDISPQPRLSPVDAAGHAAAPRDELAPPSFDHLVGAGEQRRRHLEAHPFAVLRLITNLIGAWTGSAHQIGLPVIGVLQLPCWRS
jgi:hypothetical protein